VQNHAVEHRLAFLPCFRVPTRMRPPAGERDLRVVHVGLAVVNDLKQKMHLYRGTLVCHVSDSVKARKLTNVIAKRSRRSKHQEQKHKEHGNGSMLRSEAPACRDTIRERNSASYGGRGRLR